MQESWAFSFAQNRVTFSSASVGHRLPFLGKPRLPPVGVCYFWRRSLYIAFLGLGVDSQLLCPVVLKD